jgi:methylenetetrahydrofolate dehydrogenase (NADP+)/methenyltetrahydrofolate cyclohydrolase
MLIIDGKKISEDIKHELKLTLSEIHAQTGQSPGLTVIIVGENPASQIYVRNKAKACAQSRPVCAWHFGSTAFAQTH